MDRAMETIKSKGDDRVEGEKPGVTGKEEFYVQAVNIVLMSEFQ
jgi:hypothetical protein